MITIIYSGTNISVTKAAQKANELLQDNNFFQQIATHGKFDMSSATSTEVADVLKNAKFQMMIELYYPPNPLSKALAYDDPIHPLTIHLNARRLNRSIASICATIIHESVHAADAMESSFHFGHGDNSSNGKGNTAPYWIDNLAYSIVSNGQPAFIVFQHDKMSNDIVYKKPSNY